MKNLKLFLYCSAALVLVVSCTSEAPLPVQSLRLKMGTSEPNRPNSSESTEVVSIAKPADQISCTETNNPAFRQLILNAVNEIRSVGRSCGSVYFQATTPLKWNDYLTISAQEQAHDMSNAQIMSHYGSTGMDIRQRIKITGYKGGGAENVASGQRTVAAVMHDWVELSPGHCANIMNSKFTDYALACAEDKIANNRSFWAQHFGSGH